VGFAGKVTPEDIQHVEQYYFQRGAMPRWTFALMLTLPCLKA